MNMETAYVASELLADKQYHPAILQYDVSCPNMQKPELVCSGKLGVSACNGWNNHHLSGICHVQDTVLSALHHIWSSQ